MIVAIVDWTVVGLGIEGYRGYSFDQYQQHGSRNTLSKKYNKHGHKDPPHPPRPAPPRRPKPLRTHTLKFAFTDDQDSRLISDFRGNNHRDAVGEGRPEIPRGEGAR